MAGQKERSGGARPGAGRKPAAEKMKVYTYKATEADHAQMQANAEAQGMSLSEFIRRRCLEDNQGGQTT